MDVQHARPLKGSADIHLHTASCKHILYPHVHVLGCSCVRVLRAAPFCLCVLRGVLWLRAVCRRAWLCCFTALCCALRVCPVRCVLQTFWMHRSYLVAPAGGNLFNACFSKLVQVSGAADLASARLCLTGSPSLQCCSALMNHKGIVFRRPWCWWFGGTLHPWRALFWHLPLAQRCPRQHCLHRCLPSLTCTHRCRILEPEVQQADLQ